MAKFRLVKGAGDHNKIEGKVYREGQTVEHEANLVTLFPGKFELIAGVPEGDFPPVSTRTPFDTHDTKKNSPAATFEAREDEIPVGERQTRRLDEGGPHQEETSVNEELMDEAEQPEGEGAELEEGEEAPARRTATRTAPRNAAAAKRKAR